jgi:hypothetical protein
MESLDYVHHQVWTNSHKAKREKDGRTIFVIAPRDPGYGNWLDTAGHDRGTVVLRILEAKGGAPKVKYRVSKI